MLTRHQKCLHTSVILDISTFHFILLSLFDVNVLESVCLLLSNLVSYLWDKFNISKRINTTSTATSVNNVSLPDRWVFLKCKNCNIMFEIASLYLCIFVFPVLLVYRISESPVYLCIFSIKSGIYGSPECLKSHCKYVCSGLQSF